MVMSSTAPLLLLDGDLNVVAASASFCHAFHVDPAKVAGRQLLELGEGEWNIPQLRSLLTATASGDATVEAYELDLEGAGGRRLLILNAQKLAYGDPGPIRLLLAVTDVTQSRLLAKKDRELLRANEIRTEELLRDNEILMQEVRHRVANSLQIIASVLMQSARGAKSEETRGQLRDAHHRVMSIADLQDHLAASTLGTVNLRTYLTKLCDTITASMIVDPNALSLTVTAQDVTVDAGISVSLGLVVTELVINALKHGFPDGASGNINVDYAAEGASWTLTVSDTGVGMPTRPSAEGGLGTSIVQALARQLRARVQVASPGRGTKVSLVHSEVASQDSPASQDAV
ncbi:MAG: signal transduction histidine kinase [Caulobacteraceae bacterium]|nr:signal transduction histidine kinase [Caulobacteraceae bacterium]